MALKMQYILMGGVWCGGERGISGSAPPVEVGWSGSMWERRTGVMLLWLLEQHAEN